MRILLLGTALAGLLFSRPGNGPVQPVYTYLPVRQAILLAGANGLLHGTLYVFPGKNAQGRPRVTVRTERERSIIPGMRELNVTLDETGRAALVSGELPSPFSLDATLEDLERTRAALVALDAWTRQGKAELQAFSLSVRKERTETAVDFARVPAAPGGDTSFILGPDYQIKRVFYGR